MTKKRATAIGMMLLASVVLIDGPARAQHYQSDFPPEEFRVRWERIFDHIGDNAVAVVQGMAQVDGFIMPRQGNSPSLTP